MEGQDIGVHLRDVHKKLFNQLSSLSGHQKYTVVIMFCVTCVISHLLTSLVW